MTNFMNTETPRVSSHSFTQLLLITLSQEFLCTLFYIEAYR